MVENPLRGWRFYKFKKYRQIVDKYSELEGLLITYVNVDCYYIALFLLLFSLGVIFSNIQ